MNIKILLVALALALPLASAWGMQGYGYGSSNYYSPYGGNGWDDYVNERAWFAAPSYQPQYRYGQRVYVHENIGYPPRPFPEMSLSIDRALYYRDRYDTRCSYSVYAGYQQPYHVGHARC